MTYLQRIKRATRKNCSELLGHKIGPFRLKYKGSSRKFTNIKMYEASCSRCGKTVSISTADDWMYVHGGLANGPALLFNCVEDYAELG